MSLLGLPLLLAGFALGALVYAGIALTVARSAVTVWRAITGISRRRIPRADANELDRRVAQIHHIGDAERSLRRAA